MPSNANIFAATQVVPTLLASGRISTTSATTVYTVPTSSVVRVTSGSLTNISAFPVVIDLAVVPSGSTDDGTHHVLSQYSLPAHDTFSLRHTVKNMMLSPGDSISITCSLAAVVDVVLSGMVSQAGPSLPSLVNPAPSTSGYTTLNITSAGGAFVLDPATDYVVSATSIITAPVNLSGGRNIVWKAGHIQINDQGPTAVGDSTRRGLTIADGTATLVDGRIVHIEGLLIDGDDLDEGIDVAAPTAIVRIANCEVYNVHFRGSDDRDGTGTYIGGGNHPNALQTWGGFKQLWVDGFNFTHSYEGIRLQNDKNAQQGPVHLRRVAMTAIGTNSPEGRTYYGHTNLAWARDVNKAGKLYIDNGTVFSTSNVMGGWVAAHPNPRVWPANFAAFQGGFYFGRAGIVASSTFTPVSTQHTFDAGTESWQLNNAASLSLDTIRVHDGAGSLRVVGSFGTGFTAINPVGPSIAGGSRDKSSFGNIVSCWVMVDSGAGGSGWKATIQVRDSSFNVHQGNYTNITPGVWTQITYDATGFMTDVEKWGVSVARDSGTANLVGFNIDTFQIGSLSATSSYITDPEPGLSVASDTLHVFPATVTSGSDSTGTYLQLTHTDLTAEDGTSPGKIYTTAPTLTAVIPTGIAGLLYQSPN